jgi:hypothetical protein
MAGKTHPKFIANTKNYHLYLAIPFTERERDDMPEKDADRKGLQVIFGIDNIYDVNEDQRFKTDEERSRIVELLKKGRNFGVYYSIYNPAAKKVELTQGELDELRARAASAGK